MLQVVVGRLVMNTGSRSSSDDFSRLAGELEALVALQEQRGGSVFPIEWVSEHHESPYRMYVVALRTAARTLDREGLANALRSARQSGEDEISALQGYLLDQRIGTIDK
jgi:hypothetical protein